MHFPKKLNSGYLKFEGNGKPKVAIAKFIGKMQKKSGIIKSGFDAMPLFLLDDLLINYLGLDGNCMDTNHFPNHLRLLID